MNAYKPSLASRLTDDEPAGYRGRDMIGKLPDGRWVAILDCGRTHGPTPSREHALACCNGACDCWRNWKAMRAELATL